MSKDKFAVIKTGGKQYLVTEGQKMKVEKLAGEKGSKVEFDEVLMVQNGKLQIGQPVVEGVRVEGEILDQFRDKKKVVFKYKSKTRQAKLKGHRQNLTEVEIKKISAK
jgi:large subunit ribosomal protein L21